MLNPRGWYAEYRPPLAAWLGGVISFVLLCLAAPAAGEAPEVGARPDSLRVPTRAAGRMRASTRATAERMRWLARRKQFSLRGVPYGLTTLPVAYLSVNKRWTYGGRLHWTDYGRVPYRYKVVLGWRESPERKFGYTFRVAVRRFLGTGFGFTLRASLNRTLGRYFGRGNNSVFDKHRLDPRHPAFRDEGYYQYFLERPEVQFALLRDIRSPFLVSIGFGLSRAEIRQPGSASLLFEEAPPGIEGGVDGYVALALRWDTRDDPVVPRKGVLHEWSWGTSRLPLLGLIFTPSDHDRFTASDIRYIPLSARLHLANRLVFEVLQGDMPIDAYGEIAGSSGRMKGLGGDSSLRGFAPQRFIDDVRFLSNSELRFRLANQQVLRQYLEWQAIVFADLGRVWPNLGELTPRNMHLTGGAGLRLHWNADFVIRLEVGQSSEQTFLGLQMRPVF